MSSASTSNVPALAESMSGATEHVQPPLGRVAKDGNSYTEAEFAKWYGSWAKQQWNQASASHEETVDSQTPPTTPVAASS